MRPPGFKREYELTDLAATCRLGARLADRAACGDVFALEGDLGAGKTALARAFIRQAAGAALEVPSPTFNLVLTYPTPRGTVWHFDLYRVNDPAELDELGLDEALAEGIALIEWPERMGERLPADALHVRLEADGDDPGARRVALSGSAAWTPRLSALGADV